MKINVKGCLSCAVLIVGTIAASGSSASPVLFDLTGTFNSGSVLTGSLTIDSVTGRVTAVTAEISAPASLSYSLIRNQVLAWPEMYQVDLFDGVHFAPQLLIGFVVDREATNLIGFTGGQLYGGSGIWYSYAGSTYDNLHGWATLKVPEPSTLILLGLGLVGLAFTRRRKQ